MVQAFSYNTTSLVMESWEDLRRSSDYEKTAGTKLLRKLFVKVPETKELFGFKADTDPFSPDLVSSPLFVMKASYAMQMFDTAFGMLGPDVELLSEILHDLGTKHARYGISRIMFKEMGNCLTETMEEVLGKSKFDSKHKAAVAEVYDDLAADMLKAQK